VLKDMGGIPSSFECLCSSKFPVAAQTVVYQFVAHWLQWYILYLFALGATLYADSHIRRMNLIFSF
jgi:hypothetical protein